MYLNQFLKFLHSSWNYPLSIIVLSVTVAKFCGVTRYKSEWIKYLGLYQDENIDSFQIASYFSENRQSSNRT